MKTFITAILILASAHGSSGQQKLILTMEKAVETGLENSKFLHSSLMKVQSADAKSSETTASRLPTLKFGASYTRLSETPPFEVTIPLPPPYPSTFVISPSIFDNYNLRLSLQQPLFTGFRLQSSSDMADYNAQATAQDYEKDKADLVYNIRSAYWNLYKAGEFKKVIDNNVQQIRAHLNDVQNFYEQGIVTNNEVLKVQVQLSNAQVLQIDAGNNVRLATLGLDNVLGLPLETDIQLATLPEQKESAPAGVDTLLRKAMDQRPELKSMAYRVKVGESAVTMARSGWFPQIYLSGNYYYARPNQRIIPAVDKFIDTWDVSLSASLDIWNWGSTVRQTQQAQAQLAQAQDGLGQMQDGITLEVTQTFLNFTQSGERIGVAEKGVQQAEENYRITDEKFKSGLALNSDLLDAEAALLTAQWNHIQALVDRELAGARLLKAIGE
jgi:outer membrane protein